jgi:asparagine synthase (glutamine-hydrolysing)
MARRFLAIVSRGGLDQGLAERWTSRIRQRNPRMRISVAGKAIIAVDGMPGRDFARGTIVGSLFDRHHRQPVETIGDAEAERIVASRGQRLIERYWGDYIAILSPDEIETLIVRAPFGELPCYRVASDAAIACASDVELLAGLELVRPALAVDALVRELAWGDLRGSETCLTGLEELLGGDRLVVTGGNCRTETLWSPWDFVGPDQPTSVDEQAERVRRQVIACVDARASSFDRVLLLLSGGLDSSIVAASLAAGSANFDLVTMTTRDPLGDERGYAATMAGAVGRPLHEARREIGRIDPGRSPAARLPRPAGRLFEQDSLQIGAEIAGETGAQAIFTGGGGDNVFCSLQSAAPVADRLLTEGPVRGVLETACAIGRVAQASVPAVLLSALGRLPRRNRRSPAAPELRFLAREARDAIGPAPHPWLAAPADALPGRAAHIKLLAVAESFMCGFDPQAELPMVAPLLGQPLVETCLAIPSWHWFSGSSNRAVARRAFSGDLPQAIAWRRSKGTPDSFVAEIYERFRPLLRDRLLAGRLARERVIDREAVEQAFAKAGGLAPTDYLRLIRLAEVELWTSNWAARRADI